MAMAGKEYSSSMEDSRAGTPAEKAAVVDAIPAAAGNVVADAEAVPPDSQEELVEMPEDHLRWLLAQTRETDPVPSLDDYTTTDPVELKRLQEEIEWLQAEEDDFFEYQAWARSMLEKDGRVMVPKDEVSPEEFQEAINEYWYGLLREYDESKTKTEVEAAVPSD